MPNPSVIHWPKVTGALALAGLVGMSAAICASPARAQTYTVLYRFKGGVADGENPAAGLLRDAAGTLYGTTISGPGCDPTTCAPSPGMVFTLSATGTETVVHKFTGNPDGADPYGSLLGGASNSAYGVTAAGGTSNMGAVFKLATTGETVLHSFTGPPADGAFPYAGLVQDSAGNLYGTTSAGGASNNGAVFKLTPSGTETLLYSFTGGADGGLPYGGLLRNSAGDLYGTTSAGGIATGNCFPSGCGVVFLVDAAGTEHVIYRFTGSPDGAYPYAGLTADSAGNLYGTTYNGGSGGCTNGCGVVFELDRAGTETVLHSFEGYPADGAFPYAGLVRNSAGTLYGTTTYGGVADSGTVFSLATPAGTETVLYSFKGTTDGALPLAPLILGSSGDLYGTTYAGGVSGAECGGGPPDSCGVVFKLEP
jgi:uncharacterized repeat protein (TIGR03803 family)